MNLNEATIEQLEARVKEIRPRWAEVKNEFKDLDSEMGLLYSALIDKKREVFERTKGITQCAPHLGPSRTTGPKKLTHEQLSENVRNMNSEDRARLLAALGI